MNQNTFPIPLSVIAEELNRRASEFEMGSFQQLRSQLKNHKRRSPQVIFSSKSTFEGWAFHSGGRPELQYNIAYDGGPGTDFRHGIAFSLETSQSLPSIDPLVPKVALFNDFMRLNADEYADMRMWHWSKGTRSSDSMPAPIPQELIANKTFIFLGLHYPVKDLNYDTILNDFDRLLPIYLYVESNGQREPSTSVAPEVFKFRAGFNSDIVSTSFNRTNEEVNVLLMHNLIQKELYQRLIREYGSDNVGGELQTSSGTRIDMVVRQADNYRFYEIKTYQSARACIREALGQLLEYSYWPGSQNASELVIVGPKPLDDQGREYLETLRRTYSLPLSYEHVILPHGKLPVE